MIRAVIRAGLFFVSATLFLGCAATPSKGWEFELERRIEGRGGLFSGGAKILSGRAGLESTGTLRAGDEVLYGVCLDLGGNLQIWYVHLRVIEVKVRRWLDRRRTQPHESKLRDETRVSRRVPPSKPARAHWFFGSLDHLMSDIPVARIRAEVFDSDGKSRGAASSQIAVARLMSGLRPAAIAGFAQRSLMAGRVTLGPDAEVIRLANLTDTARRDIRTLARGKSAITGFFRVLKSNPVTRELLFKVIALPSLWSMIKTLRIRASMSVDFFDSRPLADGVLPEVGAGLWSFPLMLLLNKQPALVVRVVVGGEGAPNGIAAGVSAVVGEHPSDPSRRIHLELIATRRGPMVVR